MRQDNLVATGYSNKFAHEIKNMRLNTVGDYTTASWATEKGTKEYKLRWVNYVAPNNEILYPLGQAVLNDIWVLFCLTNNNQGIILKIYEDAVLTDNILYAYVLYKDLDNSINFDRERPIETITFYEAETIQKVYWTDGINQPRMINIYTEGIETPNSNPDLYNFVRTVALNETVNIEKIQGGAGQFPAGTVKYALTYFNKYGQESNVVWTSRLYYPTKGERGLAPEELSGDEFKITVNNYDKINYDYLRLYSIIRTTDDSTPIVRIVEDQPVKNREGIITFIDPNTKGEIIDPTILQYLGGVEITAETFNQKDNTLFLGNINLKKKSLKQTCIDNEIELKYPSSSLYFTGFELLRPQALHYKEIATGPSTEFYPWYNQLNERSRLVSLKTVGDIGGKVYRPASPKIFKYRETYRFGIQCQDTKGNWSDVVWIGDYLNTFAPQGNMEKEFAVFRYTLKQTHAAKLSQAGYRRARLVCCYPTNSDRSILAQGVLCPTVWNKKWKGTHSPDYISSWFMRTGLLESDSITKIDKREIQSSEESQLVQLPNNSEFYLDTQYLTFHSPEIQYDESIQTLDWSKLRLRIVGTANPTTYASKLYLDVANQAEDYLGNKGLGFVDKGMQNNYFSSEPKPNNGWDLDKYGVWKDIDVYNSNYISKDISDASRYQAYALIYDYTIHPFQRKYLNNYMGDLSITEWTQGDLNKDFNVLIKESSIIREKVWSTLRVSNNSDYSISAPETTLLDCVVYDSNEPIPIKVNGQIYQGNINTLCPLRTGDLCVTNIYKYQGLDSTKTFYNIIKRNGDETSTDFQREDSFITRYTGCYHLNTSLKGWGEDTKPRSGDLKPRYFVGVSSELVPITYKSTAHCVVALQEGLTIPNQTVYLAELYRDDITDAQRFGGTTEEAIQHNIFLPCGEPVSIDSRGGDISIVGDIGDTYYMRYDNLKTFPYTREDINQIVDIYSFMCETRINLDGRYDINRGLTDNTIVDNTNFGYINKSYTQKDNIYTYHTLDELASKLDNFPNQLTWTKTKIPAEDVDTWTNITLASIANADGTLGEITKIINLQDDLFLFQDHGVSKIGYNERTAITTDNGVPLELANSGKFTGLAYLTKEIGCQNKWSISTSKNGVFFIDDSRQELLTLDNMQSVSTLQGFDAFMINQLPKDFTKWNPQSFNNFVTYYDKLSNDVYFINNNYCLAWNEQSSSFTSFYDYNAIPYMVNIGQHSFMFKDGKVYAAREADSYSTFFGENKDYWMTIVCDGQTSEGSAFPADKVFNNVEFRADIFNIDEPRGTYNSMPFNTDAAWNGYQLYKEFNTEAVRKFNTWRVQLPRATYDINGVLTTTRDRIRNPFCYIKLKQDQLKTVQTDRVILHDLAVYFDIR